MACCSGYGRTLAATLALVLSACGGAQREGTLAPRVVERYEIVETAPAVLGLAQSAAIERAVKAAAVEAGLGLRGDGRLALIAQQFWKSPGVDAETLASAAQEQGLVDAELDLEVVRAPSADLLQAALSPALASPLREHAPTHFGAFVAPGGAALSIVLGRRPLTLDPVPRKLAAGAVIELRGMLPAAYANPKLVVTGPSGEVVLPAGAGPGFELRIPTREAGAYRLELQGQSSERVRSLASIEVYVGVEPRRAARRVEVGVSLTALREALYARSQKMRAEHALPSLAVDAPLQARAEQQTQALARAVTHRGLPSVARGRDEQTLWTALLADGALATKLVKGAITRVGCGVVQTPNGYLATCVLAGPPGSEIASDLAPSHVLLALNEHRRARAAVALRPDPELTSVAARTAREFAEHPERSERDVIAHANAEIGRFGLAYRRVAVVAALVHDPLEAATLEPALDAEACAAGIAVASRERPGNDADLAVVIALGWPHALPEK